MSLHASGFEPQPWVAAVVVEHAAVHDTAALWRAHEAARGLLEARGMALRPATTEAFEQDLQTSMISQRRFICTAPYRCALTGFLRAMTGRSPHKRPLREQQLHL